MHYISKSVCTLYLRHILDITVYLCTHCKSRKLLFFLIYLYKNLSYLVHLSFCLYRFNVWKMGCKTYLAQFNFYHVKMYIIIYFRSLILWKYKIWSIYNSCFLDINIFFSKIYKFSTFIQICGLIYRCSLKWIYEKFINITLKRC